MCVPGKKNWKCKSINPIRLWIRELTVRKDTQATYSTIKLFLTTRIVWNTNKIVTTHHKEAPGVATWATPFAKTSLSMDRTPSAVSKVALTPSISTIGRYARPCWTWECVFRHNPCAVSPKAHSEWSIYQHLKAKISWSIDRRVRDLYMQRGWWQKSHHFQKNEREKKKKETHFWELTTSYRSKIMMQYNNWPLNIL